ncbi:MAG: transposase [Patescibacteria group bacterium]|nr:transposase [Patescibacteria group bacterium]
MPSKYVVRNFGENKFYHVFNRGVEKRDIFLDEQDYSIFLYYFFIYSMPLEIILEKYPSLPLRLRSKNLNREIEVISYCLMPNHFHLLLLQKTKNAISRLMQQLTGAHTAYFNKKYDRVGGLVQGKFKAVLVDTDTLLLHINRYIHLNPLVSSLVQDLNNYKWSSYKDYLGESTPITCSKNIILKQFSSLDKYLQFIKDQEDYSKELKKIENLVLDG